MECIRSNIASWYPCGNFEAPEADKMLFYWNITLTHMHPSLVLGGIHTHSAEKLVITNQRP